MQKFLVLISFSVLFTISIGCDRIQKIVTPHQEETLKIGFIVAGERVTYPNDLGGTIATHEFHEGGISDFTAQLSHIASMQPDALFVAGFVQDVSLITQQARQIPMLNADGEPTIFLGADSWDSECQL